MSPRCIEIAHCLYPIIVGDECTVIDYVAEGTTCVLLMEHADLNFCNCSGLRTAEQIMQAELEYEAMDNINALSSCWRPDSGFRAFH